MNAERTAAAKRLEEFGWALIRYARRIERCCVSPSGQHEDAAQLWKTRAIERMARFRAARDAFRGTRA